MRETIYKRVDKPTDRKFRFEGLCPKCGKVTPHRYHGGSLYQDFFRCMKCESVNEGKTDWDTDSERGQEKV